MIVWKPPDPTRERLAEQVLKVLDEACGGGQGAVRLKTAEISAISLLFLFSNSLSLDRFWKCFARHARGEGRVRSY